MQENWLQLIHAFNVNQRFVLATICATTGSTYRKMGAIMLITEAGDCIGLLSGGCLEADICLHAEQVLAENKSQIISYDLKADSELLWGLGLGCDGAIDILLQPLTPENNHLAFTEVISAVTQRKTGVYCQQVLVSSVPKAQFFTDGTLLPDRKAAGNNVFDCDATVLVTPVTPPIAIVICGAGPDVEPVAQLLLQMGWQVEIWDHRQHYLEQACFSACTTKKIRPEHIAYQDFSQFDGAVIMTHNLEADHAIVEQAWQSSLSYIGVLGPIGRRNKLIKPIELNENDIKGRLYGPIGLNIGGRGPQAIALSITAQIQQHFSEAAEERTTLKPYLYNAKTSGRKA